jgi:alginate O-acetyltransferase complex protein AlgI
MLFNSFIFLYAFLPVTYLVFWQLKTKRQRFVWLTLASYVFYGYWNWKFCFWMALSTGISYASGLGLRRWTEKGLERKLCLIIPITLDLLILFIFKYAKFGLHTIEKALNFADISIHWPVLNILLPIGISFYTFHTISYIIDSYRGDITPTDDFWEFSCYVSLFSQLVAGPIVRFRQVERDLETLDHKDRRLNVNIGWSFFAIGMIKKILIADTLAAFINPLLSRPENLSTLSGWFCLLGYAYQLYFDFSGYSDMAVGLGYLFGIRLPQNFNSPYKADGPSDFWRRWHMSLSTCLRDYLYIPLGGNRGSNWFTARNILITMVLGGLWHGANYTFLVWGAYHGILLIIQRSQTARWDKLPLRLRQAATFFLVLMGWVFFRAENVAMALKWIRALFSYQQGPAVPGLFVFVVMLIVSFFAAHTGPNTFELRHEWRPAQAIGFTAAFAWCLVVMYGSQTSPFLYFQF